MPVTNNRVLGQPEFAKVPSYRWIDNSGDAVLAVLFVLLITLPPIVFSFSENPPQRAENRIFAGPPRFGIDPLTKLPAEIDAHFADYFGFRSSLVHWDAVLKYKWLRISSPRLVVGRDRWAFYTGDRTFENHMGLDPFTPSQLRAWREYLENHQAKAAALGARYVFVAAPDKMSVYPEMLPASMRLAPGRSRLDQLLQYLRTSGSSVPILDLRPPLLAAKLTGLLYFPQDTHWNGRGYFEGYRAICEYLRRFLPNLAPRALGRDYKTVTEAWGAGDWSQVGLTAENLTFPSDFLFLNGPPHARRVPLAAIPELALIADPEHAPMRLVNEQAPYRAVILHDSFFFAGIPERTQTPFAETFGDALYVGVYPTDAQFLAALTSQHPDVVIEERCERLIAGTPER